MKYQHEFCPACQMVQSVEVVETEHEEKLDEGDIQKFIQITVNCTVCHKFIRSEESPLD